ncbi:MAG TPA: Zn-dependent hydrolase [Clostridia bacterium]|nr:Zn-dependent hydrolase [Clostridia bacterium]
MKVNNNRIKNNLMKVGEVGKGVSGGITRLAFSKEFYEASAILKKLMEEAQLEVKEDMIGDIFGKRCGKDNDLPVIMVGSHLDTVRNGGVFDGNLGIIAALECMYVLEENSIITRHPIEIAAFNAEEGSELGGAFASRVMLGIQNQDEKELANKLACYGLTVENVKQSVRDISRIKAFLELHIEQGGDLEMKGIPIGIVDGIAGITRYRICVNGEANHAGTTPMVLRKDALIGASKLILEIERMAKGFGEPMVATVGIMKIFPEAVNVIPGRVEFILEVRDLKQERIEQFIEQLIDTGKQIERVQFEFQCVISKPPIMTNAGIASIIERVCINKKLQYQYMASGAGHDAQEMARKVPAGMIFIPSRGGKSHCAQEWTDWEEVYKGTEVLLDTILLLDKSIE